MQQGGFLAGGFGKALEEYPAEVVFLICRKRNVTEETNKSEETQTQLQRKTSTNLACVYITRTEEMGKGKKLNWKKLELHEVNNRLLLKEVAQFIKS